MVELLAAVIEAIADSLFGVFGRPGSEAREARTRRLRSKQGLCAYCGYDLRGNVSGVCPECGAPTAGPPARQFDSPRGPGV